MTLPKLQVETYVTELAYPSRSADLGAKTLVHSGAVVVVAGFVRPLMTALASMRDGEAVATLTVDATARRRRESAL